MEDQKINLNRRRFLTLATGAAGSVIVAGMAAPFVASWFPSEKAKAAGAPVEVDVSKIGPGELITVAWQGRPIFILNRTAEQLKNLKSLDSLLVDAKSLSSSQPDNCANEARAVKANIFVALAVCTHLGCVPSFRPDIAPADLGSSWKGGFYCPCHGSKFDLAGRVFKGVPAPINLAIPPYDFLSDTLLRIGTEV